MADFETTIRGSAISDAVDPLRRDLETILQRYVAIDPSAQVGPLDAFFVYRLLLGRNPDPSTELAALLASGVPFRKFLSDLLASREFSQCSGYFPPGHLLMSEVEGFRFWFDTADREMGVLMALGMYERGSTALIRRLVRPGMSCLDVGAQTGFYTCLLASVVGPEGRVQAFEPMPSSYSLLRRNLEENRFDSVVRTQQIAGSDRRATLYGSLVARMYVIGSDAGEPVDMVAVPLDQTVEGHVDFMKLDVEGHEPAVIRGMSRILHESRPMILSEVNGYWLEHAGSGAAEYVHLLEAEGYEVRDADHCERRVSTEMLGVATIMNILGVPQEQVAIFDTDL